MRRRRKKKARRFDLSQRWYKNIKFELRTIYISWYNADCSTRGYVYRYILYFLRQRPRRKFKANLKIMANLQNVIEEEESSTLVSMFAGYGNWHYLRCRNQLRSPRKWRVLGLRSEYWAEAVICSEYRPEVLTFPQKLRRFSVVFYSIPIRRYGRIPYILACAKHQLSFVYDYHVAVRVHIRLKVQIYNRQRKRKKWAKFYST